jgi:hypothetical protein
MTKTLHMNTPEQTMNGIDIDDFDNYNERNLSKNQHLIEQLQAQLVHNQMRRTQARNYLRILGQSNTPAYWYKAPPVSRSVYYYDPNYQKYVQRRSNPFQKTNLNVPVRDKLLFFIIYNIFYPSPSSLSLLNRFELKDIQLIILVLFHIVLFH